MSKLITFVLILIASPAFAQNVNFNYLGNQVTVSVVTAQTNGVPASAAFGNPTVLPQQTGRQSCWIQYQPASKVLTTVSTGFVFFGPAAPTTSNQAFVLTPFQILNCEQAAEVEGNAVWLSSTQTGDTFTIKVK